MSLHGFASSWRSIGCRRVVCTNQPNQ
jgi:hypothetical protein